MRKIFPFLILLIFNNATAQVDLNNGLQAFYPFSGNTKEALGNGLNGIISGGVQLTTDRFGNPNSAYNFDGNNSYIRIPNNPTINSQSAFTVTAFFQSNVSTVATILGKIDYFNGIGTQYQVAVNYPPQPGVLFGVNQPNANCAGTPVANFYVNSWGTISQNRWYCFATTFENGVMKLYLDGVLISTTTASFQTITNCPTADVQIGSWWNGDPQRFRGKIDEIRFYNRALNANEVAALCSNANPIPCNNWLNTPTQPSWVSIGDLDIAGNQLTVEALINIKGVPTGGVIQGLDIVSKHTDASNVNYLLRSTHAELSTTSGFYSTPEACNMEMNKNYHVAMVYNGSSLKYYRNGFLVSELPATGNMIQNNFPTGIGFLSSVLQAENLLGYINEVKIWNIARTQTQIRANMFTTLQSPTSQIGLQAYYSFDNLLNKQGNSAWNGTLAGAATINATNTSCNFVADSCLNILTNGISGIINEYTPALNLDVCKNVLNVTDAAKFNVGDTVLLIQMKGSFVDSSNSPSFGNLITLNNAGNYEFNYVKSKNGNNIELLNKITKQYNLDFGAVQLVRVPYFGSNVTVSNTLTCLPWNGSFGGVLAFFVKDTLKMLAPIDVSGKGFRGGVGYNSNSNQLSCNLNDYYYPSSNMNVGLKGESIASISNLKIKGKGKLAAGGGGGQGHNSGGAGGANGGNGGSGGYQLDLTCGGAASADNRGMGGIAISTTANATSNKLFLGSGGGAGQADNPGSPPSSGGSGGGLIIIQAEEVQSNGFAIQSNGDAVSGCVSGGGAGDCHDAMGGGGAGGTILLSVNNYIDAISVTKNGGNGGNVSGNTNQYGKIGPGGGGGGGALFLKQSSFPSALTSYNLAGNNGVILSGNNAYGATPGTVGSNYFNSLLQIDNILFKNNIDSVRFTPNPTACRVFNFNGFGYTNSSPIAQWQWDFGDGASSNTQNTSHTYNATGTFNVKLTVTDINGCKDSIIRAINSNTINVSAGNDVSYCSNIAVSHTLNGSGDGISYIWQPAAFLNDNTLANPIATISSTTKFYLTQTGQFGCSAVDSVTITVNSLPILTTFADTAFCSNNNLVLNAAGASSYSWMPASAVSNTAIPNPMFTSGINQMLTVTGSNSAGCTSSKSFNVTVKSVPIISTIPDSTICSTQSIVFSTIGAQAYSWSPVTNLSDPNIASPIFFGTAGNTYTVTGTANNGCSSTDVVTIRTTVPGVFNIPPNKTVCVNGTVMLDGNNGNSVTYQWSPSTSLSNTNSINPTATPTIIGDNIYNVSITEPVCNSSNTYQVKVLANALPVVTATSTNDLDCAIRTTGLSAAGAVSYSWSPIASLSNPLIATPIATPTVDTEYKVVGTNLNGCKGEGMVTVQVKGTAVRFDIPNTFTPNGDGKNDCFGIKNWGPSQSLIFMIYDRYGNKVFETNNYLNCWDGRYKGQPANAGAYVYFIKSQSTCGNIEKKGSVILLR